MQRFNQTSGVHTMQRMYGCELDDDRNVKGYNQLSYDGEDFLSLDLNTLTWTAAKPQAVIIKTEWDKISGNNNVWKHFLEKECIEWLEMYIRETMERKGKVGDLLL